MKGKPVHKRQRWLAPSVLVTVRIAVGTSFDFVALHETVDVDLLLIARDWQFELLGFRISTQG